MDPKGGKGAPAKKEDPKAKLVVTKVEEALPEMPKSVDHQMVEIRVFLEHLEAERKIEKQPLH